MRTKYIVIDRFGFCEAAVFSETAKHIEVATGLRCGPYQVLGAGYCHLDVGSGDAGWSCYGESTTLNVKSRGAEDAKVLNRELGIEGEINL